MCIINNMFVYQRSGCSDPIAI